LAAALGVEALIWPTLPADGPQTVLSRRDPESGAGFALVLTPDGMALEVGGARVVVGKPLRARIWYRVWASADPATGTLRVGQQPLRRAHAVDDEGAAETAAPSPLALEAARVAPAEAVYVGDLYSVDVLGARGAGLGAILLDPGGVWGEVDCPVARTLGEAVDLALQL
jgi:ribonucleotide monophosphatase NagD (HAD superfamily)